MAFPVRLCPQGNIGLVKFFSRISRCKLVITSLVAWQDNVYVAGRDLSGSEGAGMRVAVSYGLNPPVFTQNQRVGNSLGEGLRLAKALYYVYGNRDATTGNNRLAIRQIMADRAGNTTIGSEYFVTGQVQASIPQVAVTNNGTVGVFYYTFDGFSDNNLPIFTTHLAISKNQGVTFVDREMLIFLSPVKDDGNFLQQALGNYMQMKSEGNCFYGAFTGNGAAFGRPFANNDPIFFKTCVKPDFETKF